MLVCFEFNFLINLKLLLQFTHMTTLHMTVQDFMNFSVHLFIMCVLGNIHFNETTALWMLVRFLEFL